MRGGKSTNLIFSPRAIWEAMRRQQGSLLVQKIECMLMLRKRAWSSFEAIYIFALLVSLTCNKYTLFFSFVFECMYLSSSVVLVYVFVFVVTRPSCVVAPAGGLW